MSPAHDPAALRASVAKLLRSAAEAVEKTPDHMWDRVVADATPDRRSLAVAPWLMRDIVTGLADLAWGMEAADPDDPRIAPARALTFINLGVDLLINSPRLRHLINDCQGPSGHKSGPKSA